VTGDKGGKKATIEVHSGKGGLSEKGKDDWNYLVLVKGRVRIPTEGNGSTDKKKEGALRHIGKDPISGNRVRV